MNKKTIIILLIVCFLLGGLSLYPYAKKLIDQKKGVKQQNEKLINNVNLDKINSIKTNGAELSKNDDQWFVDKYPADKTSTDKFINDLKNSELLKIVSINPGNYAQFGVEGDTTKITIKDDSNNEFFFWTGGYGAQPGTSYIRVMNKDNVFLLSNNLSSFSNMKIDDWRDKNIFSIKKDDVKKISYNDGWNKYALTKSDDKWLLNNKETEQTKIDNLFTTLLTLKAAGFTHEDNSEYKTINDKLTKNTYTITTNDDKEQSFNFATVDDKDYIKFKDQPDIFIITKTDSKNLLVK